MSATLSPLLLAAAVCWPLALAALLPRDATRGAVMRLVPWAAAPALAAALLLPNAALGLPGLALGAQLLLDATGRFFLAGGALLWLASGWALRARLAERRFGLIWLLALFGSLLLPVAGDLALFLTAATLSGYGLFALLAGREGSRAFVVALVLADLLLFELVLLLAHANGGLELATLSREWHAADKQGLLLGLLLLGFGAKAGLAGVHFWLAPLLGAAPAGGRPAVVAFLLGGGVLGWLRLWPVGSEGLEWAGGVVQGIALAGGVYAVVVGTLQSRPESVFAYAGVALAALWLAALGQPGSVLAAAAVQAGLALAALLCCGGHGGARLAVTAAAGLLLVGAPLTIADGPVPLLLTGGVGFLVGRGWRLGPGAGGGATPVMAMPLVGGALLALAANPGLAGVSAAALVAASGGVTAGVVAAMLARRLPQIPPGDALGVIGSLSSRIGAWLTAFGATTVAEARDRLQAAALSVRPGPRWRSLPARVEPLLRRWGTAMALFLALGLLTALLAAG